MEQTQVFEGIRQTMADLRADMRDHRAEIRDQRQETSTAFRALDDKVSRYFMWMVGIQVTTLLAIVAVLSQILRRP